MQERVQLRLMGLLVIAGVVFLGLAARLVYLGTAGVEQAARANGLEIKVLKGRP